MHVSFESGLLEDPSRAPEDHMFRMTANPGLWPEESDDLRITLEEGVATRVRNLRDGTEVDSSVEVLRYLNLFGGKHGIGRIDVMFDQIL